MTADIYSHALRGRDQEAARRWYNFMRLHGGLSEGPSGINGLQEKSRTRRLGSLFYHSTDYLNTELSVSGKASVLEVSSGGKLMNPQGRVPWTQPASQHAVQAWF
jgi:hypothetical protein